MTAAAPAPGRMKTMMRPAHRRRSAAYVLVVAVLVLGTPASARDADRERPRGIDWADWIPSIGIGASFYGRGAQGAFTGDPRITASPAGPNLDQEVTTGFATNNGQRGALGAVCAEVTGICQYDGLENGGVDGPGFQLTGQIFSPVLAEIPGRPRLLLHAGNVFTFGGRTLARQGDSPMDFPNASPEPEMRVQINGRTDSFWYVGGGFALQLPFESYRTWLKLSVGFSQERLLATGQIDQTVVGGSSEDVITVTGTQALEISSIAPGIGIETEVGRFGPISLMLSGDVLISQSLGPPPNAAFQVESVARQADGQFPFGSGTGNFSLVPSSTHVVGGLTVRFAWGGTERRR